MLFIGSHSLRRKLILIIKKILCHGSKFPWSLKRLSLRYVIFLFAGCQYSDNTPPWMYVDRNWILSDAEPVGSVVTRVSAEDNEQDELTFGLEASGHTLNWENTPQRPLPFYIDNSTGTVYLNESLKDRVSCEFSGLSKHFLATLLSNHFSSSFELEFSTNPQKVPIILQ